MTDLIIFAELRQPFTKIVLLAAANDELKNNSQLGPNSGATNKVLT